MKHICIRYEDYDLFKIDYILKSGFYYYSKSLNCFHKARSVNHLRSHLYTVFDANFEENRQILSFDKKEDYHYGYILYNIKYEI